MEQTSNYKLFIVYPIHPWNCIGALPYPKSVLGNILGISFKQLWEHIEKFTRPFLLHIKHFIWPHKYYGESIIILDLG
jgi:hypothetical protein